MTQEEIVASSGLGNLLPTIEKVFTQTATDLHSIIVLDNINVTGPSIRISSHDLYGPLPQIAVEQSDRHAMLEAVNQESCKLYAISRVRADLTRLYRRVQFLEPTTLDGKSIVGVRIGTRTFLAEGESFVEAYRALRARL